MNYVQKWESIQITAWLWTNKIIYAEMMWMADKDYLKNSTEQNNWPEFIDKTFMSAKKSNPSKRESLRSTYNNIKTEILQNVRQWGSPTPKTQDVNIYWREVAPKMKERAWKWFFKTNEWYLIPLFHWWEKEFWMFDKDRADSWRWWDNSNFWMFLAIDYTTAESAADVVRNKKWKSNISTYYSDVQKPILHPQAIATYIDDPVVADEMIMKYYEMVWRRDFVEAIHEYQEEHSLESLSQALREIISFDTRWDSEFRWDAEAEVKKLQKYGYDSIIFNEWYPTVAIFEPNKHLKSDVTNPENIEWLTNEAQEDNMLDVYFQENKNQIFEDLENIEKQEYWPKKTAFDYAMELNPEKATREELTLARREIQDRLEDKQLWKRNQKAVERKLEEVREAFRKQRLNDLSDNNQNV